MNYIHECSLCNKETMLPVVTKGADCLKCVYGKLTYVREAYPWEDRGMTVEQWCEEHGHVWEPYNATGWPPRRECQVCGVVEARPPPEPFTDGSKCSVCGRPFIKIVLDHEGRCSRCGGNK